VIYSSYKHLSGNTNHARERVSLKEARISSVILAMAPIKKWAKWPIDNRVIGSSLIRCLQRQLYPLPTM